MKTIELATGVARRESPERALLRPVAFLACAAAAALLVGCGNMVAHERTGRIIGRVEVDGRVPSDVWDLLPHRVTVRQQSTTIVRAPLAYDHAYSVSVPPGSYSLQVGLCRSKGEVRVAAAQAVRLNAECFYH